MRALLTLCFTLSFSIQAFSCTNCLKHSKAVAYAKIAASTPSCHNTSDQDNNSCPACEINLCSLFQNPWKVKITTNILTANSSSLKTDPADPACFTKLNLTTFLNLNLTKKPQSFLLLKNQLPTLAKNKNWQAFHSVFLI